MIYITLTLKTEKNSITEKSLREKKKKKINLADKGELRKRKLRERQENFKKGSDVLSINQET